ncbi:MAG: lectin like domain-containing protein [Acutalibacteraceae bacterium]
MTKKSEIKPKIKRGFLCLFISVLLSFTAFTAPVSSLVYEHSSKKATVKEINEVLQSNISSAQTDNNGNIIDNAIDSEYYNYPAESDTQAAEALPKKYSLPDNGLSTSVKNQKPFGTCWAFAAISSIESNAIKKGISTKEATDFSELHLASFARSLFNGDGIIAYRDGISMLMQPGNPFATSNNLYCWMGIDSEESTPYTACDGTTQITSDWSVREEKRFNSVAHVQNALVLPNLIYKDDDGEFAYDENAEKTIKEKIIELGAVSVVYYADQSKPDEITGNSKYFSTAKSCQYAYDEHGTNHSVSIIGWDDNFSKDNFPVSPPKGGAWLCKNSWGTDWTGSRGGDEGYFYLSYYDVTAGFFSVFDVDIAEDGFDYEHNYQYDYLGLSGYNQILPDPENKISIANVFTMQGDETLKAVSAVTANPGSTVDIKIYKLNNNFKTPTDGELLYSKTEVEELGGYHTIPLDKLIAMDKGESFSVIQTIKGSSGWYAPTELILNDGAIGGYNENNEYEDSGILKEYVHANEKESYIYDEGKWVDVCELNNEVESPVTYGNCMIKAFTADTPEPLKPERLNVSSYDVMKNKLYDDEANISDNIKLTLPAGSRYIKLNPYIEQNGGYKLLLNGEEINADESIDINSIKKKTLQLITSNEENTKTHIYNIDLNVPDTVLADGYVTLTDTNGVIPSNTSFSSEEIKSEKTEKLMKKTGVLKYKEIALHSYYGEDELTLQSGDFVSLEFELPDDYPQNTDTQLYLIKNENDSPEITAVGKMENGIIMIDKTADINASYVLVHLKELPPVLELEDIIYNPRQTLADVPLPECDYGVWRFSDESTVPTVDISGYSIEFTAFDNSAYRSCVLSQPLSVLQAIPSLDTISAESITYGDKLNMSELSFQSDVNGFIKWVDPDKTPNTGNISESAVFTPEDLVNYECLLTLVPLEVKPKSVTVEIADAVITCGEKLPNEYEFEVYGILPGDSKKDITLEFETDATNTDTPGQYAVTAKSAHSLSGNYAVTKIKNGTLTVKGSTNSAGNNGGNIFTGGTTCTAVIYLFIASGVICTAGVILRRRKQE